MNAIERIIAHMETEDTDLNIWMLPYSTLMLILMILFASLYGMSYQKSVEYETAIAELAATDPNTEMSRSMKEVILVKSMQAFLKELDMQGAAEISIDAHNIKLKLSSPVMFDSAKAELKPDIMPLLAKLLEHLVNMDNTVIVEGHTDNVPIYGGQYPSNWELSAARAFSVIYFYIQRDIAPSRVLAHGFGEFRPAYDNITEFGRAMNRRIEITILRGAPRA